MNGAIIHRLPKPIYDSWCETHGVGSVLSYDDLVRVFDQMDDELGVDTAPDAVFGRNNALMAKGVEALGGKGNRIRRNVRGWRRQARCLHGCPTGQKQSMNLSYVPRAIAGGARVYAECRVSRVLAEGGRARYVVARFRTKDGVVGAKARFEARRAVIMSASAIQTPLLLEASGLGRESGLVGRRFQAHPGTSVLGLFDDPVNSWFGATQGYETTHWWDERMKFEAVGVPLSIGAARLPGFGADFVREIARFGHISSWGVQVRCRAMGRVKRGLFGRTVVKYCPTPEDIAVFKIGVRRLVEMNFAAGAREVLLGIHGMPARISSVDELAPLDDLPDDPRLFHYIAAHLFGTATMGTDPKRSVVGPDCQSHEMPGLFVTDSSCFPSNLGVNPQHSIAAVSWLAAERIAA